MAWSNPSTRTVGYQVRAADWNEFVNNFLHLGGMTVAGVALSSIATGTELGTTKTVQVYRSGNQSISGSTDPIDFNGSALDPNGWHSTSVFPNRITVDEDGYYFLDAMFRGTQNNVLAKFRKNGVAIANANFRVYRALLNE